MNIIKTNSEKRKTKKTRSFNIAYKISKVSAQRATFICEPLSNNLGSRIATASERGTVIRIFNVTDGSRLIEFRYYSILNEDKIRGIFLNLSACQQMLRVLIG